MSLRRLLTEAEITAQIPEDPRVSSTRISSIVYDSRECRPGALFVAVPGEHTDGHRFIPQAVAAGAKAIVHQAPYDPTCGEAPAGRPAPLFMQVPAARPALSALSDAFYGRPSRELCVIGVTGTDGKSSTVWFTYQLLRTAGVPAGFISTVSLETEGEVVDNPWRQSTPEAPEIHRSLREMVEAGKRVAVVEATSHGLSAKTSRLAHVAFDIGVFTNLSHEHIEFHGSYEQYRSDKGNLFRALGKLTERCGPRGIINANDAEASYYAELVRQAGAGEPLFYSLREVAAPAPGGQPGHVRGEIVRRQPLSTQVRVSYRSEGTGDEETELELPVPGWFNVANALAGAMAAAEASGMDLRKILQGWRSLSAVAGRLEPIASTAPFSVLVDYAHTPGSFEKVLPLFRESSRGRVIALFGSAGERDREKRGQQGRVAARYCEVLVLADEDPRGEDRMAIIEAIAAGARETRNERSGEAPRIITEPDRRRAIRRAYETAEPGDTVVLLGKGHEKSIIYAEESIPWYEARVAREVLREMGYQCS